jgi:hypothetical protein
MKKLSVLALVTALCGGLGTSSAALAQTKQTAPAKASPKKETKAKTTKTTKPSPTAVKKGPPLKPKFSAQTKAAREELKGFLKGPPAD